MREIVLDTETTGLDPAAGHRVIEIGCIELVNYIPTGARFQCYVNPERDIPEAAERVHGITRAFLADKPLFADIASVFLDFIGLDDPLVIHNAGFDIGFLNAELERAGYAGIDARRAVDTVALARRKFPGAQASLDALCRRFGIDNSARTVHGAVLDATLLAEVYLELIGGRQPGLALSHDAVASGWIDGERAPRARRHHAASDEERARHAAFLAQLVDPIWAMAGAA